MKNARGSEEQKINPGHLRMRQIIRVIGISMVAVGGLLFLVGIWSFFAAFGSMQSPRYFWCAIVGLPVGGMGAILTLFGFAGSVARFQAGEMAPVGKDTFNYMAEGTQDGVETVASAVARGFSSGHASSQASATQCPSCHAENDLDASFCDNCGQSLRRLCPSCSTANDADARFCDGCGGALSSNS